jgi:hypothetical protein
MFVRSSFVSLSTALFLGLATGALANPIACEKPGEIGVSGDTIKATFLDLCGATEMTDGAFVIQWKDGDWTTLEGDGWAADGTVDTEGGSGVETYQQLVEEVDCPVEGEIELRVAYTDFEDGDSWDLYEQSATCGAVGDDDDDDAPPPSCGLITGGDAAAYAGVGLLIGVLALMRRRP